MSNTKANNVLSFSLCLLLYLHEPNESNCARAHPLFSGVYNLQTAVAATKRYKREKNEKIF